MATPLSRLSEDELCDHGPWLRRVARGLVASESDADDLVQDVWLELARGNGPIAHLRALSARVARRLAGHRREAEGARARREAAAARSEALPGADELEGALEIQRLLLEELTALDELHRTPLMLHFYEGLSAAEIARRRGVPASTVRSQLARALAELRARMDRRHGGERALWVALVARLPERGSPAVGAVAGGAAAGGLLMTTLGKSLLVAAGALGVLFATWRFVRPSDERGAADVAVAAGTEDVRPVGSGGPVFAELAEPGQVPASRVSPLVASTRDSPIVPGVPVVVLDDASGRPLAEFVIDLANPVSETRLETDSLGRATIPQAWFEAPFELHLRGDDARAFEVEARELGPADRPRPGDELVLRCATGPTYTLLFDAPPPRDAELAASLSAGAATTDMPWFTAKLHRDGPRVWTRFAPTTSGLGDGPWTLTVLDDFGLWRARGPVRTIVGEQPEPVLLTSETLGALRIDFDTALAPERDSFHASLYRIDDEAGAHTRHLRTGATSRMFHFPHVVPGEYQVWIGSPVHETAGARARVDAGATNQVRVALDAKSGVTSLRILIASSSGRLDLPAIHAEVRDLASGAWKNASWSDESTATRRVLLAEGLDPVDHEVTLHGLESLGGMDVAPGRAAVARPGGAELVFTLLDVGAPAQRTGRVRVLAHDGVPIAGAQVTTCFDEWSSFRHDSDPQGWAQLERIVEGVRFDLLVGAEGFRPRVLRDLALPLDGDMLEVRLEPGWGAWLLAVVEPTSAAASPAQPEPASGASVRVDGVWAGRLDGRGRILLSGTARPATIEITHPGHRVAYGDVDPVTGAPSDAAVGDLWVVLEPTTVSQDR